MHPSFPFLFFFSFAAIWHFRFFDDEMHIASVVLFCFIAVVGHAHYQCTSVCG